MSALSPHGPHTRHIARIAVATMACHDLVLLTNGVLGIPLGAPDWTSPALYQWLAFHPHVLLATSLVGLLAAGIFAAGRAPLRAGTVTLIALHLAYETFAGVMATLPPEPILTGACLSGWLLGTVWGRGVARRDVGDPRAVEQWFAEMGAVGLIGITYFMAGASKMIRSGLEWDHRVIWHLLQSLTDLTGNGPVDRLVAWLMTQPTIAVGLAAGTVLIQVAAPLMLVGRRTRQVLGTLLLAMHLSMLALGTLVHVPIAAFAIGFLLPWPRLLGRPSTTADPHATAPQDVVDTQRRRALTLQFAGVGGLLVVLAWALPVDQWMAHRSTQPLKPWRLIRELPDESMRTEALRPDEWRAIAPLKPGAAVAGWRLKSAGIGHAQEMVSLWRRGNVELRVTVWLDATDEAHPLRLSYDKTDPAARAPGAKLLAALEPILNTPRQWPARMKRAVATPSP
ncbi:MAG: hypothetical protein KC502_07380 [Myxococcales bacterium]|nr:hypothetical protein [Myxococcales bacterium]